MALYLFLVQGLSLWGAGGTLAPLGTHPEIPGFTMAMLARFYAMTGFGMAFHIAVMLVMLYASMAALFFLTKHVAKGPVWLGSLAGSAFMAHPIKTEIFFESLGLYYLAATLMALLSALLYVQTIARPGAVRYWAAVAVFTGATIPFTINAALFVVLFVLEFHPATPETRRWERLLPFAGVAILANGLHMDALYADLSTLPAVLAPLVLLIYPIGLLPETVDHLVAAPWIAWVWGGLGLALVGLLLLYVRNGAFRISVAALFLFRFFPGAEPVDLSSLDGGGQLLLPLALGCLALAGFSRWVMQQEDWGRPTVALTTMLCVVLFTLQFQANRAWVDGENASMPGDDAVVIGDSLDTGPVESVAHD